MGLIKGEAIKMAGTKSGGVAAASTNKTRYFGKDFYAKSAQWAVNQ